MKPVMFTRAQTDALCSVVGEVLASSPELLADSTGLSLTEANRRWDVLARAREKLWASYPDTAPEAPNAD